MLKEKILEEVEKLSQAGKYDKAIKELQKLVEADKADIRLKLKMGDLYVRKKEIPKAIQSYQEVADYYIGEKFYLKAIAVYKTLLKISPGSLPANEKLGDLYREVGMINEAVHQYYIVAGSYDSVGKIKESVEIRKKILETDPSNTTSRIRLAELMQAGGEMEKSLAEYEQAARLLRERKEQEGLIEVYEKILYFKPENTALLIELCRIYFGKRDFKKALARIDAAPAASKEERGVVELWCEALLEDRQIDKARRKFQELYRKQLEAKDADGSARVYFLKKK
ncbi:MAG: tetratricopeptide repeat protein [Deltaproteobacteria bacterium]|nr:tetratricopeptide repeat protein [Deltaproteobacteria bacterium]